MRKGGGEAKVCRLGQMGASMVVYVLRMGASFVFFQVPRSELFISMLWEPPLDTSAPCWQSEVVAEIAVIMPNLINLEQPIRMYYIERRTTMSPRPK